MPVMITIEEAIDIAGQLHHFQDIVDDIRVFEEPMTNDDPFLTFTTKSGRLTGFVDHRPFMAVTTWFLASCTQRQKRQTHL